MWLGESLLIPVEAEKAYPPIELRVMGDLEMSVCPLSQSFSSSSSIDHGYCGDEEVDPGDFFVGDFPSTGLAQTHLRAGVEAEDLGELALSQVQPSSEAAHLPFGTVIVGAGVCIQDSIRHFCSGGCGNTEIAEALSRFGEREKRRAIQRNDAEAQKGRPWLRRSSLLPGLGRLVVAFMYEVKPALSREPKLESDFLHQVLTPISHSRHAASSPHRVGAKIQLDQFRRWPSPGVAWPPKNPRSGRSGLLRGRGTYIRRDRYRAPSRANRPLDRVRQPRPAAAA